MIPDWLYELSKNSKPITKEIYDNLIKKNYSSGEPILIGDLVLFGLLLEPLGFDENGVQNLNMEVIKFKLNEIGNIYELDPIADPNLTNANKLPRLKYITDKSKINTIYP